MVNIRKLWHIFPIILEFYLLIQPIDMISIAYYLKYFILLVCGNEYLRLHIPLLNNIYIKHNILKSHEINKISDSIYYLISIYINLLIGSLFPQARLLYVVGMTSLAIGDPSAYIIGTLFPFGRFNNGKTLSGCIGCCISCIIVHYIAIYISYIYRPDILLYYNTLTSFQYFYVACVGGIITSITELVSGSYDNLTIPLITSVSMHIFTLLFINRLI